ncbi:MAG: hypothetical protein GTN82_23955 [Candidatus Aminicenantes bacterium]|nr:hypothetical protein [Candidatus Aminicenantes bacterium]NIM81642.1 hypothetical protein [Candidatus Aminicenantes bacterium]NIN44833.1 hypothetical protein [Candidatus Aminicenantes bacterium]NIO87383.1 hypothetical protein [Candidatus Aminicenantes bacterium]NIQ69897.1 hypothetical protein [Candidatus Aminicenantes bacterium]
MSFNFKDFSDFKFMITPVFIKIIFWICAVIIFIYGLYIMVTFQFLQGLIMAILGPIAVRIYCELLIVIFKIHEGIEKLVEK